MKGKCFTLNVKCFFKLFHLTVFDSRYLNVDWTPVQMKGSSRISGYLQFSVEVLGLDGDHPLNNIYRILHNCTYICMCVCVCVLYAFQDLI